MRNFAILALLLISTSTPAAANGFSIGYTHTFNVGSAEKKEKSNVGAGLVLFGIGYGIAYWYLDTHEKKDRIMLSTLSGFSFATGKNFMPKSSNRNTSASYVSPSVSAIEAHIKGEFKGWSGNTVFILDNGQIWKQAIYAYMYTYAYRPKVWIIPDGGNWIMKVEGVAETLKVTPVR